MKYEALLSESSNKRTQAVTEKKQKNTGMSG